MKQTRIPPLLGKTIRSAAACLLAVLVCTAHVAVAATHNVGATNDRTALNNAFRTVGIAVGDIIQLGNGQVITFAAGDNVVVIDTKDLTLKGFGADYFVGDIQDQATDIQTLVNTFLIVPGTDLLGGYQAIIGDWTSDPSYVTTLNSLSRIQGGVGPRQHTLGTNQDAAAGEHNKWFSSPWSGTPTVPSGDPDYANGLSIKDIRFSDVEVNYQNHKFVNGLIGTHHMATTTVYLGDITGNAFTDIDVFLTSYRDTDYLAGGGIIGVRATGELGGPAHAGNPVVGDINATAEMGIVSGNIFDSITITATGHLGAGAAIGPNLTGKDATGSNFTYRVSSGVGYEHSTYLEGGGLVGVNAATSPTTLFNVEGYAYMEKLSNNFFTNIHIRSNDVLLGGGLVGLNNNSKFQNTAHVYAHLEDAIGNIFGNGIGSAGAVLPNGTVDVSSYDITVDVDFSLRGGGVLGMNGLSAAEMRMDNLESNAFAGISVRAGTYVRGGGIVGLQTNDGEHKEPIPGPVGDDPAMAHLQNAQGNLFLNQRIEAGTTLHGGGVIGLRANMGEALLGLEGPLASIDGGLDGNLFKDIDVIVGTNPLVANNNPANITKWLYGGGIVGVSGFHTATLARAVGNYFEDLTVTVRDTDGLSELYGGGFIGVDAYDKTGRAGSTATIGTVEGNAFIGTFKGTAKSNVYANRLYGGGIIGATNDSGTAHIRNVTDDNIFRNLKVTTDSELVGGGVLGVWSDAKVAGSPAQALIETVADNMFTGMEIRVGTFLEGGGIIGARSDSEASIDTIRNNQFRNNDIEIGTYLDGGGIVGVTGEKGSSSTYIETIESSEFIGNNVTTGMNGAAGSKDLFGGLIYSYGLDKEMTVTDSLFLNNTFMALGGGTVYGTNVVDTGANSAIGSHTVNLTGNTTFDDNQIIGENPFGETGTVLVPLYNSYYFGVIPDPDPLALGAIDYAEADAKLVITPGAGKVVALYDPIWVNQMNDGGTIFTFHMEVNGDGEFIWGGKNVFQTDGDPGTITLAAGSTTTILDGGTRGVNNHFGPNPGFLNPGGGRGGDNYAGIALAPSANSSSGDLLARHTMSLDAKDFTFYLNGAGGGLDAARLNVEGHNNWDLSGRNDVSGQAAHLNGHLHFNLNNTNPYARGQLPTFSALGNDYGRALLTINVPDVGAGLGTDMVNLGGYTVTLSDRMTVAQARTLNDGDRFFLIEVTTDAISGQKAFDPGYDPLTDTFAAFTNGPIKGDDKYWSRVSAGIVGAYDYNFIIDLNEDNAGVEEGTRYLVARLEGNPQPPVPPNPPGPPGPPPPPPPGGFEPPDNGRIVVITFLQRDRFFDIPPYNGDPQCDPCGPCEPCDPCNPCDPCASRSGVRGPSDWVRAPFAEVQGTWYRADTGSRAYGDVRGTLFAGGVAAQRRVMNGRVVLGSFIDAGDGKYDTRNYVSQFNRMFRGNGDIDYIGGGSFISREWNNGFRLDTMFRIGGVKNEFFSSDLRAIIAENVPVTYKMSSLYLGANVGLNHTQRLRNGAFDVYSRYSWVTVDGGKVELSTTEWVNFKALHSHRLTSGGRLTAKKSSALSMFVGAAYEHEFAGISRAVELESGRGNALGGSSIRGGTGVGELGLIMRPREWFQLTTGLEGYAGKRDGGSVYAAAVWQW